MNIEGLKKRKELLENNLKNINERITSDTQQAYRVQGAIINVNELIAEIEKEEKEEGDTKKNDKKVK